MGWDDQMRDLKTIGQVHVRTGDVWRGWDEIIRWEILKQLTKLTYWLETDEVGWDDEMRDLKNERPSSRTGWRRMKKERWHDQMRDLILIDLIHVHPGDGRRHWVVGLQSMSSMSSNSWRTLWASTMKMFRNSTTLWSLGVSRILMISFLERNCLSHRRL